MNDELPEDAPWYVRLASHLWIVTLLIGWLLPAALTIAMFVKSDLAWWRILILGFLILIALQASLDSMLTVLGAAAAAALRTRTGGASGGMWFLVVLMAVYYIAYGAGLAFILLSDWPWLGTFGAIVGLSIAGFFFKSIYGMIAVAVLREGVEGA